MDLLKHHMITYSTETSVFDGKKAGVLAVHCIIHRQRLVAKHPSGPLHKTISTVITAVNKIKAHALNTIIF